jgi:hypothetical protein
MRKTTSLPTTILRLLAGLSKLDSLSGLAPNVAFWSIALKTLPAEGGDTRARDGFQRGKVGPLNDKTTSLAVLMPKE